MDSVFLPAISLPLAPLPNPRPRPCDRCHAVKEKCRRRGDPDASCERCIRLQVPCQTKRRAMKRGRKPRLVEGNRLSLIRPANGSISQSPLPLPSEDGSTGSPYSIGSDWVSESSITTLSTQTSLVDEAPSTLSSAQCDWLCDGCRLSRQVATFPELSWLELHFLDVIISKQMSVQKYLIGPSFREAHLQVFSDHLKAQMPLLKDAFIACASHLAQNRTMCQLASKQQIGYKRAAAAIETLRNANLRILDNGELVSLLLLGVAVVTFGLHHTVRQSSLCKHILTQVRARYCDRYELPTQLGSDGMSFVICLLGTEIEECLLGCQVPTLRIRPGDVDDVIDRFIGIAAPLLTHFYDICHLAWAIRYQNLRHHDGKLHDDALQRLSSLEHAVCKWQPTVSDETLASSCTAVEISIMSVQANVLKTTALLVLHRLQFAFGTEDAKARSMAQMVLDELDRVAHQTDYSIPFGDLAYMVSCLESTGHLERRTALQKAERFIDFSPHLYEAAKGMLASFWTAKDAQGNMPIYWETISSHLGDLY